LQFDGVELVETFTEPGAFGGEFLAAVADVGEELGVEVVGQFQRAGQCGAAFVEVGEGGLGLSDLLGVLGGCGTAFRSSADPPWSGAA